MKNKIDETINTYNNIVEEYIEYFNSKDLHGNVQFQKEIDVLVEHLENGSKILDVGTAIGDYPKYLTEKCDKDYEVIGVDSSENMIKKARQNASKAALINLTKNLAIEYAPYINVNAVAPGWIDTEMNSELPKGYIRDEKNKILLKRFAEPEEIAEVVLFLASDKARYIDGETVGVDGGLKFE